MRYQTGNKQPETTEVSMPQPILCLDAEVRERLYISRRGKICRDGQNVKLPETRTPSTGTTILREVLRSRVAPHKAGASQICTVPSREPEAMDFPSRDQATAETSKEPCP